ncbi:MAG: alpha/beta hydrolase [Nitrospira sp.]
MNNMKRWRVALGRGIVTILLLTIIAGILYEQVGRQHAAREYPPPGQLVDIGGRRLQIDCRGSGSPTVVFESGLDLNGSLSWSFVHQQIAEQTTRACAYSRAGILWSDPPTAPQTGKAVVHDLHAALSVLGERGPFVLVGHSLGGAYIMTYTKYFGPEVAGVVFVDASHPDQEQRFKSLNLPESSAETYLFKAGAALNWTGIVRAVAPFYDRDPHQPVHDDRIVKAYASTSLGPMMNEQDALQQTLAEAGTFRDLGDRPVVVLTAVKPLPPELLAELHWSEEQGQEILDIVKQLHEEQAAWSSNSRHQLVADAGHYIQFDRPDVVIAAIQSVVESVRVQRRMKP